MHRVLYISHFKIIVTQFRTKQYKMFYLKLLFSISFKIMTQAEYSNKIDVVPLSHKRTPPDTIKQTSVDHLDHGYSWIVCICGFMLFIVGFSTISNFGIYYVEWLEYFHAGKMKTSLINAMALITMGPAGKLVNLLNN